MGFWLGVIAIIGVSVFSAVYFTQDSVNRTLSGIGIFILTVLAACFITVLTFFLGAPCSSPWPAACDP